MNFENEYIKCKVEYVKDHEYIRITGHIINREGYNNVILIASNPIDKRGSYSGTGMPFPCPDIAFENTKNIFEVNKNGNIDVIFSYPNSYYTVADKRRIVSSLFLILEKNTGEKFFVRMELKDLYVLRSLVNREERTSPNFYYKKFELLPVDTAEQIMIAYGKLKETNNLA